MAEISLSKKHTWVGILLILLGAGLLGLWLAAFLMQIQTTEAYASGGPAPTIFHPDWSVILQIPDMFKGDMPITQVKAIMWGWGVELLYLVIFVGYEVTHDSIKFHNKHLAGIFTFSLFIIFVVDFWTDFSYGFDGNYVSQFAFALIAAFLVAYGSLIGCSLIGHGVREFTK